jgi:hypothetical protein
MTISTTLPSRLAIGMCGIAVGAYCAYSSFRNGQAMAPGLDGIAFGSAFAAIVIGSWFLLPLAEEYRGARSVAMRAGWALCLAFVLINAIGFTATHRTEGVGSRTSAIQTYDAAMLALPSAMADLAAMKANARWQATAGCSDATAEKSKEFCSSVQAKQAELAGLRSRINDGRPGAADAQAETIAWVMRLDAVTVGRALPIFMAVVLDIAASLFMFAALAPVNARPQTVIDVTPVTIDPDPAPKKAKPKATRKKKLKQITYQPAISAKVDGRTIAGRRRRVANDDGDFVPATAAT